MTRRTEFLDFALSQMQVLGAVTARSMFGGYGLYCDGLFFALISDETLYFKADAQNQAEYEARKLPRFSYSAKGKTMQAMYYAVPAEVYDEPTAMRHWGQLALAAALRARKPARKTAAARKKR